MKKIQRRYSFSRRLTLGQYYPGQSSLHQLDPRIKLLASVVVMSLLMWVQTWPILFLWSLILAVAVALTQLPPRLFVQNLRAFLWLFGMTIVLNALSPNLFSGAANSVDDGTSLQIRLWGVCISGHGVLIGVKYATRLALLIVVAGILSFTTIPTDLTDGLESLLRPLQKWRVPVHELAFMTTLALRFVPTIIDEAVRIQRAQLSRGANFSGSLLTRIQALVPLLVPLFVATFHRADDLAVAMEARGYRGSIGRISFREMRLQRRDVWTIASLLCGAAITVAGERLLT